MKTLVILAVGAVALYQVAKRYNINSVDSLRKTIMPRLEELIPELRKMVPQLQRILSK